MLMETMAPPALHVLLVEDSEHDARAVQRILERGPLACRVTHCVRGEEARDLLSSGARWYDVALVDHGLPGMSGLELCKELLAAGVEVPLVMLTGGGGERVAVEALKAGVADYLVKDPSSSYLDLLTVVLPQVVRAFRDRVARERAESALVEAQELFRSFMNHSPAVAYMKDEEGRYVYVNEPFEKLFEMSEEEWKGRTDAEIWGEEVGKQLRENDLAVLRSGETREVHETIPHDGQIRHWMAFRFPIVDGQGRRHVGGMAVDVTEVRRAEEERRQLEVRIQESRRLESLGMLAGGIAHDFNNLLASILGNASLATMETPPESPSRRYLEAVEQACMRAAEMTDQLLLHAGKVSIVPEAVDLSALVEDMAFVLKVSVAKEAQLRLDLGRGVPEIEADPAQLRQVLSSLVVNASESLPPEGGTITVRTGSVEADAAMLAESYLGQGLPEGTYAFVEVEDTGTGMDPATEARLFEPFLTPNSVRRGLGLPAALGIVRAHHGAVVVRSQPGRGTAIRVLVPVREAGRAMKVVTVPVEDRTGKGPEVTVLVVDDEESLRNVARVTLRQFGYGVLEAASGAEAVDVLGQNADRVGAVLLDASMPGMDCAETLRRLRGVRPDVKVIVSSGYDEAEVFSHLGDEAAAFLKKPYRPLRLIQALHELLGE